MKRRLGDRYDGKKLRKADPFYKIIPYIMKTRNDSQVYFDTKVDIDKTIDYINYLRKEKGISVGYIHIFIAAMVRTISQKPRINRFVSGKKIYARNEILVSLAIKKDLNEDTAETTVKIKFEPTDTIVEVVEKVNKVIEENKGAHVSNDTDKVAKVIMGCPGIIIRSLVGLFSFLDHRGRLPKMINRVSPFHSSFFITDLGSLGLEPVYHHIYNFGTTSIFMAFGMKNRERVIDKNNQIVEKRFINMKVVLDERICDGYYFSRAFRYLKKVLENPSILEEKPKQVYIDDEL